MEGLSTSPTIIEPEKKSTKEIIDFVFTQSPELASVGKPEEYAKYLDTIFPNSKFKEIAYHNSDAEFKDEGFKPMKPNFDTLNSLEGVYNFSTNRNFTQRYGKNTYAALLNIQSPIKETSSGEFVDDIDRPLSEALFKIGKQRTKNFMAPGYNEKLKDTDGVINHILGEGYIAKHPKTGKEWGIPCQTVVTVFDHTQICILGSRSDMQKFQEFITKESELAQKYQVSQ